MLKRKAQVLAILNKSYCEDEGAEDEEKEEEDDTLVESSEDYAPDVESEGTVRGAQGEPPKKETKVARKYLEQQQDRSPTMPGK